jgi:hypothetical protein
MTTISGAASNSVIELSGGGDFQGGDLKTEEMIVSCSGGGNIQAWVLHQLDADLSGGSSLTYFGDPQTINQNPSGGSSIKALGPK